MDRADALALLQSESSHERLKAARALRLAARPEDRPAIDQALKDENVSWVRRALEKVLRQVDSAHPPRAGADSRVPQETPDTADDAVRQAHARATEEVTATLLHEFQPIIGLLKVAAQTEITSFKGSQTEAQLHRIDSLIDGIETLKRAAATPRSKEFDFAALISEIVADVMGERTISVSQVGPSPLTVRGDKGLLRLAISNGLRNAVDAVETAEGTFDEGDVVVTWGETDIDVWLAIIDRGIGLTTGSADAFKIGTTTKRGHSGLGLATAKQAMESMEGEISLTPAKEVGARFEIRWYR